MNNNTRKSNKLKRSRSTKRSCNVNMQKHSKRSKRYYV